MIVSYHLPASAGVMRVRVYDSRGRVVWTLADGEASGSRGEIVWDGCDDERRRVRTGIYVVVLEGLGADGSEVQATKGLVVVAARMSGCAVILEVSTASCRIGSNVAPPSVLRTCGQLKRLQSQVIWTMSSSTAKHGTRTLGSESGDT